MRRPAAFLLQQAKRLLLQLLPLHQMDCSERQVAAVKAIVAGQVEQNSREPGAGLFALVASEAAGNRLPTVVEGVLNISEARGLESRRMPVLFQH